MPYTIGIPPVPMHRMLRSAARRFPLRTAIIYEGNRLTYRRLNRESSRFANLLRSIGVAPGDRVLVLLPNLPQVVIAYFGILKAAAVVVFTTPLSEPEELARQVRDSGARVLVTLTRRLETAAAVQRATQLEHVLLTNVKDYLPAAKRLLFTLQREARGNAHGREQQPEGPGVQRFLAHGVSPAPAHFAPATAATAGRGFSTSVTAAALPS